MTQRYRPRGDTMSDRWPLRYRVAKRAHEVVNRIHNTTGKTRFTWWLNCKVGSLWINWWVYRRPRSDV